MYFLLKSFLKFLLWYNKNTKIMAEEKCKKCGMPLERKEDRCPCEESVCYHCCECPPDCSCGCQQKNK